MNAATALPTPPSAPAVWHTRLAGPPSGGVSWRGDGTAPSPLTANAASAVSGALYHGSPVAGASKAVPTAVPMSPSQSPVPVARSPSDSPKDPSPLISMRHLPIPVQRAVVGLGQALRCPVCLCTMMNPAFLKGCCHVFCKDCVTAAVAAANQCPVCKAPTDRRQITADEKTGAFVDLYRQLLPPAVGGSQSQTDSQVEAWYRPLADSPPASPLSPNPTAATADDGGSPRQVMRRLSFQPDGTQPSSTPAQTASLSATGPWAAASSDIPCGQEYSSSAALQRQLSTSSLIDTAASAPPSRSAPTLTATAATVPFPHSVDAGHKQAATDDKDDDALAAVDEDDDEDEEDSEFVVAQSAPNDDVCCVCRDGDSEPGNEIIYCEACNVAVHIGCYDLEAVPSGTWYCDSCRCVKHGYVATCRLCPIKSAAHITRSVVGRGWAHVFCAIWIPEAIITDRHQIDVSKIDAKRWKLKCRICNTSDGACVQCHWPHCAVPMHPTCALEKGMYMRYSNAPKSNRVKYQVYCPLHSDAARAKGTSPARLDTASKLPVVTGSQGSVAPSAPTMGAAAGRAAGVSSSVPTVTVGDMIQVWRPLENQWCQGRIRSTKTEAGVVLHEVSFVHGSEWLDLTAEEIRAALPDAGTTTRATAPAKPSLSLTPSSAPTATLLAIGDIARCGMVRKLEKSMGARLVRDYAASVTHLLLDTKVVDGWLLASSRSVEYMRALVSGKWIVGIDWVQACVDAGSILPAGGYQVVSDVVTRKLLMSRNKSAFPASVQMAQTAVTPLFADLHMMLVGSFKATAGFYGLAMLGEFITRLGGKVLESEEDCVTAATRAPSSVLVICDTDRARAPPEVEELAYTNAVTVLHVNWVIDSIALYERQPMHLYSAALRQQNRQLCQLTD